MDGIAFPREARREAAPAHRTAIRQWLGLWTRLVTHLALTLLLVVAAVPRAWAALPQGKAGGASGPLPTGGKLQSLVASGSVVIELFQPGANGSTNVVRAFGKQRNVTAHTGAYDGAYRMMASADIVAFDLTQEKESLRNDYGRDPFGQGCLLARRLVERGVRFIEVSLHGWDTHAGNFTATPDLCEKLDHGLAALVADLHTRGMLKDTLVVVATEFGRTPKINQSLGRDHYPKAFSAAMWGGGVKGGFVFGSTNKTAEEVEDNEITIPDFNATIGHALGLPHNMIASNSIPARRSKARTA